jgi:hypothetical protein
MRILNNLILNGTQICYLLCILFPMTIYGHRIDTISEEEDFNNDKLVLLHTVGQMRYI